MEKKAKKKLGKKYQCPLGLKLHFYWDLKKLSRSRRNQCINALSGLYSISTPNRARMYLMKFNFVSMPSRACTPFLRWHQTYILYHILSVSMPSRACTPFLRYPFENLSFMRFLEPVFAGIYQNILTMTIFRAC